MDYRNHPQFGFVGNRRSGKTTRIFNTVLMSARFGYEDIEIHFASPEMAKHQREYFNKYLTDLKIPHMVNISTNSIKIESLGCTIRFRTFKHLGDSDYVGRTPIIYIDEADILINQIYKNIGKVVGMSIDGGIMPD